MDGSVGVVLPEEAPGKVLTLRSSDNVDFNVQEKVAMESRTIKEWLQEGSCGGSPILLPNVSLEILRPVLHFCTMHAQARAFAAASSSVPAAAAASAPGEPSKGNVISEKDLKAFNANFMETHDKSLLYLIEAAQYLGIQELIDLTLETAANKIKGKTPEQIRKTFNIKNDFTPEEEAKARKENKWVFEEQR